MEAIKQEGIAGLESLRMQVASEPATVAGPGAPPAANTDTAEQLAAIMGPLFSILFPAWQIQPQEVEGVAEAYAKVLDKWFPGGLNLGVELEALLITAMVFGPRLKMPRKPSPQSQQQQQGESDE